MHNTLFLMTILFIMCSSAFSQDDPFEGINTVPKYDFKYDKDLSLLCSKILEYSYIEYQIELEDYCSKYGISIIKKNTKKKGLDKKIEDIKHLIKNFDNKKEMIDFSPQYLIASQTIVIQEQVKNLILIAFSGTQRKRDVLIDAMIKPHSLDNGVMVHSGFWKYVEAFKKEESNIFIQDVVSKKELSLKQLIEYPENSVFLITGHSLGGAVATLYATDLYNRNIVPLVYTFGAPGVGNEKFVENYNQKFPLHRVVIKYDMIPNSTVLDEDIADTIKIKDHPTREALARIALKIALDRIRQHHRVKKYIYFHIGTERIYGEDITPQELTKEKLLELHDLKTYIEKIEESEK